MGAALSCATVAEVRGMDEEYRPGGNDIQLMNIPPREPSPEPQHIFFINDEQDVEPVEEDNASNDENESVQEEWDNYDAYCNKHKPLRCPICDDRFATEADLDTHFRHEHRSSGCKCATCKRSPRERRQERQRQRRLREREQDRQGNRMMEELLRARQQLQLRRNN